MGGNESAGLDEVTMTSIVWDIALSIEWMGSTEYWDKNMEEGTDYSYL